MIKVLYLTHMPERTNVLAALPAPDFEVIIADSVEETIKIIESDGTFDCLVTDAGAGDTDITGIIQRIRLIDSTIPIVISSDGDIPAEDYMEAITQGADYCLPRLKEIHGVLPILLGKLTEKRETMRHFVDISESGHKKQNKITDSELTAKTGIPDIDQIKTAYCYLKEANKKMNVMSSIIRHDALNQVTGMMIFMDMLKELAEEDNELKRYVEQIDKGLNSIHDKLVFTRDYHSLGEYEPDWQNISDMIRELLPDIEMEGISVDNKLEGLEIYSDPLLRTAFIRLIENSVRHGKNATRISLYYCISGEGCRIVLEDDGIGIPTSEKKQIFRNNYGKQAGYGLFLVRQLLSVTGINIEETGEEGQGARFEMLVPEGMYRLNRTSDR